MVCHEISGRVISHHSVGHPGRSETEIRDRGACALPFERVPTPTAGGSPILARAALGRDDEGKVCFPALSDGMKLTPDFRLQ
jgi:hypothetical protein